MSGGGFLSGHLNAPHSHRMNEQAVEMMSSFRMTAAVVGGAGRDWDEEDERDVTAPIVNCFERMSTRCEFVDPLTSECRRWDTSSVYSGHGVVFREINEFMCST